MSDFEAGMLMSLGILCLKPWKYVRIHAWLFSAEFDNRQEIVPGAQPLQPPPRGRISHAKRKTSQPAKQSVGK